jgi:DNA replication protein DnaC
VEDNIIKKYKKYDLPERFWECTFAGFKDNQKLVNDMLEIAAQKPLPNLLITGKTGCGKTHLSIALLYELIKNDRDAGRTIKFVPAIELLLEIRRSFNDNLITEFEIVKRYTGYDLLILDDLGAEKISDWTISTLYLILNNRYNNLKPIIITSNLSITEIEQQIGARIASRLAEGRVINVTMPDYRKRRKKNE